jgi:hypothetical protein
LRRCAFTACDANASCDSLLVTHPFHPLSGQRLAILFERVYPDGQRLFVCEGGLRGSIGIWEDATDRAPAPALGPWSGEVLAGLVELVALIGAAGRIAEPVHETRTGS